MEVPLTDVARVSFSKETTAQLHNPLISRAKKHKLRVELIKVAITNRPYGKRISSSEFKLIGNFGSAANAYQFVEKMVKNGEIVKHSIGPRSFFYTVPGLLIDKTPVPGTDIAGMAAVPDRAFDAPIPPPAGLPQPTGIEEKAMQYLWHYGNDLQGFIKWLKSQGEV